MMRLTARTTGILTTGMGIVLFAIAMRVLYGEIHSATLAQIAAEFSSIPVATSLLALGLCVASYTLLTCYDFLAMRMLKLPLSWRSMATIAFSAFAIGHNLGVASLSGGAIRYRAYSLIGLSSSQIASIIAFIPLTFFLGAALLLGITLLLEPASRLLALPFGVVWARGAGIALLLCCAGYLLTLRLRERPLSLGSWSFTLPPLMVGIQQLLLASVDILLASLIPFVLLQGGAELSYLTFLTAFLLAMVIGVISSVPGGIGVFESAMLLLLPQVPASVLLGAILAYRLIYYLLPLAVAVTIIVIREAQEQRQNLQKITASSIAWGSRLVPQTLGAAVFAAGAYLLIRGSIPLHLLSDRLAEASVSLPLLEMSHLLSSAIGAGLIIVARGLYRRLRRAWLASVLLLGGAIVASLIQGGSALPLFIMGLLAALACLSRAEFFRGSRLLDQQFDRRWISDIGIVLLAVIGIGLIANRHVEYSHELWWQFTLDGEASRMLRASLVMLLLVGGFGLSRLLRGKAPAPTQISAAELASVAAIVTQSRFSNANIALLGDKRFVLHPSGEAFIMYQASGGSFIALYDPIGNPTRFAELLWQFREICDAANMRCVFYEISEYYLPLYIDLGLAFVKLGEEGMVRLDSFSLEGSQRAGLRQAVSKAQRQGAQFSIVPAAQLPPIIEQLERVSNEWLKGKATQEKGFSLGFFERAYIAHFDCAVVTIDEKIVAFANLWPSASCHELSIDLMRYTEDAPKAIMDYLFAQIMLWGKANGYEQFSLGMAPLSGLEHHELASSWHKFGNLVYRFGENFYNFEGLQHYKAKFDPQWQPRFLACKGGHHLPAVLLDTTILISGGFKEILLK